MASQTGNAGNASDNDGTGTVAWSSLGNATGNDDGYCAEVLLDDGEESHYLFFKAFALTIPAGATINGVYVRIYGHTDLGAGFIYLTSPAYLMYNNVPIGSGETIVDMGFGTSTGSPNSYLEIGSSTSKWGATLTPTIVNGNFGFIFSITGSDSIEKKYVDYTELTVDYTPPGGSIYNESVGVTAVVQISPYNTAGMLSSASINADGVMNGLNKADMKSAATITADSTIAADSNQTMQSQVGITADEQIVSTPVVTMPVAANVDGAVSTDVNVTADAKPTTIIGGDGTVDVNVTADIKPVSTITADGILNGENNADMNSSATMLADTSIQSESIMFLAASVELVADNTVVIDVNVTIEASTNIDALCEAGASGAMVMQAQLLCTADAELAIINSLEIFELLELNLQGVLGTESTSSMETVVAVTVDTGISFNALVDAFLTCRMDVAAEIEGLNLLAMQETLDLVVEALMETKHQGTIHEKKVFKAGKRETVFVAPKKPDTLKATERDATMKAEKKTTLIKSKPRITTVKKEL